MSASLKVTPTAIPGVLILEPRVFGDSRGFFLESFNQEAFNEATGLDVRFVQDNHSFSARRGVLRGLHFQLHPAAQNKLVRVSRGSAFDVAVDLRPGSATFGKWAGVTLSAERWNQLFVPHGFAHGFVALEDDTAVLYKVSARYAPDLERTVRFDDPQIAIDWPVDASGIIVSEKDRSAPLLAAVEPEL